MLVNGVGIYEYVFTRDLARVSGEWEVEGEGLCLRRAMIYP